MAITTVSEPRTFGKIHVCLNGMKGFSRRGDVTAKAARDSWTGAGAMVPLTTIYEISGQKYMLKILNITPIKIDLYAEFYQ